MLSKKGERASMIAKGRGGCDLEPLLMRARPGYTHGTEEDRVARRLNGTHTLRARPRCFRLGPVGVFVERQGTREHMSSIEAKGLGLAMRSQQGGLAIRGGGATVGWRQHPRSKKLRERRYCLEFPARSMQAQVLLIIGRAYFYSFGWSIWHCSAPAALYVKLYYLLLSLLLLLLWRSMQVFLVCISAILPLPISPQAKKILPPTSLFISKLLHTHMLSSIDPSPRHCHGRKHLLAGEQTRRTPSR